MRSVSTDPTSGGSAAASPRSTARGPRRTLARDAGGAAGDGVEIDLRQTDDEAELIGWLHEAVDAASPVILNPAAFTHYSYALRDAAALVTKAGLPLVEVHISNPHAREEFRHTSVISGVATGVIAGFGFDSYVLALDGDRPPARQGRASPPGRLDHHGLDQLTSRTASVLNIDGQLWNVVEFQHVKPGKGGAFVRTKIKNVIERQGRRPHVQRRHQDRLRDRRPPRLQLPVPRRRRLRLHGHDRLRPDHRARRSRRRRRELHAREPDTCTIALHDGDPLYVELPASVVLEITYTEPGLQGDRSTARHEARDASRPATRSRCRCSSSRAPRSRSTRATGDYLGRVTD